MFIILYIVSLIFSPSAFVSAAQAPVPSSNAELQTHRHLCNPPYDGNSPLRALLSPRYSRSALGFCRTYISIPVITVTATTARTITATSTTYPSEKRTVLSSLATIASSSFSGPVVTIVVAPTEYTTETTTVTVRNFTNYVTPRPSMTHKFEERAISIPSYLADYPASQVSAACSCLSIGTSTSTETPVVTETHTVTGTLQQDPTISNEPNATPTYSFFDRNSEETQTVTMTYPTTTTLTTTKTDTTLLTIPTLCDPKIYKSYHSASDTRKAEFKSQPLTTKEDCCMACYNAKNCIFFLIADMSGEVPGEVRCHYRVVTELSPVALFVRDDLCPLGISTGSSMDWPDSYVGAEYGPCLANAPMEGEEG